MAYTDSDRIRGEAEDAARWFVEQAVPVAAFLEDCYQESLEEGSRLFQPERGTAAAEVNEIQQDAYAAYLKAAHGLVEVGLIKDPSPAAYILSRIANYMLVTWLATIEQWEEGS